MYVRIHVKYPLYWQILTQLHCSRISKNTQTSNFTKTRPLGAELFHADERTDTDLTKQIAIFRNFVPKNLLGLSVCVAKFWPAISRVQRMTVGQSTAKLAALFIWTGRRHRKDDGAKGRQFGGLKEQTCRQGMALHCRKTFKDVSIKILFRKNYELIKVRECLLSFSAESFVFQLAT